MKPEKSISCESRSPMIPRSASGYPALLTDLALEGYAEHIASQRAHQSVQSSVALEEALAPLQLIHGRVFTSAVGIALHGAESITRFVACDAANTEPGRCLYYVGEHKLLSPYYCPCGAYGYQGIRRQEAWMCKHLLALRIALLLETKSLALDTIRERKVPSRQLQEMLQQINC